jgi:hypothetical protein
VRNRSPRKEGRWEERERKRGDKRRMRGVRSGVWGFRGTKESKREVSLALRLLFESLQVS